MTSLRASFPACFKSQAAAQLERAACAPIAPNATGERLVFVVLEGFLNVHKGARDGVAPARFAFNRFGERDPVSGRDGEASDPPAGSQSRSPHGLVRGGQAAFAGRWRCRRITSQYDSDLRTQ
jgi:hypothetical protein